MAESWDEGRVVSLETRSTIMEDCLAGKEGPGGRRSGGMIDDVKEIKETLANGIKMRVPAKVWLPPTIVATSAIVVAVIALTGGG